MVKRSAGPYLKLLRLLNGLQQAELAEYLRTDQGTLSQLETARYRINPFYAQTLSGLFYDGDPEYSSIW